jgi:hypothetical protein
MPIIFNSLGEIITANDIQKAKSALVSYHSAHAILSRNNTSPNFRDQHKALIDVFKAELLKNKITSIDSLFEICPELDLI